MGTTTSSHEPLDKNGPTSFRRHASCRGTKGERRGGTSPRRMDRLRRSLRDSFRRRKEHVPESSKPHLWQADEAAVRAGTCTFHVKYLGCVEVFESRGMQVCEEALKVLRNSRRRPIKSVLFVSGDGLRVVEDENKGLIVDQTIEKVSFCAPDRNHDKGFSYICRDGTTRRWMCHGFLALKESGERLSHAVGCAFAACLERKQKRDKECGVTMNFDSTNSTFTRQGSFRQQTLTERLSNDNNKNNVTAPTDNEIVVKPQSGVGTNKTANNTAPVPGVVPGAPKPPPPNPHAIERPHATVSMLVRQGSFRGFNHLNQSSPFKRQLSLRLADLPSNLERTRSLSLEGSTDSRVPPLIHLKTPVSPIPESSPLVDRSDPVSVMCQQLSQGLQLLSNSDDLQPTKQNIGGSTAIKELFPDVPLGSSQIMTNDAMNALNSDFLVKLEALKRPNMNNNNNGSVNSNNNNNIESGIETPPATPPLPVSTIPIVRDLPKPEQWLGKLEAVVGSRPPPPASHPPPMSHLRALSLSSADTLFSSSKPDPFDADWAGFSARNQQQLQQQQQQQQQQPPIVPDPPAKSTNPFLTNSANTTPVKAFEVHM